jgi:hypothetical protein
MKTKLTAVNPADFVVRMRDAWTTEFNNTSSPALQGIWRQLCVTLNDRLRAYGPDRDRWQILPAPTGSGKSTGLALYAAMLTEINTQPGVLIVVRLTDQADALVDRINRIAGSEIAVADHSANRRGGRRDVSEVPVVVVTHAAFTKLLDEAAGNDGNAAVTWATVGQRHLCVIDESLGLVEEAQLDLEAVKSLDAVLSRSFAKDHPDITRAIIHVRAFLLQVDATEDNVRPATLFNEPFPALEVDWAPLREFIRTENLRTMGAPISAAGRRHLIRTVRGLELVLSTWCWYEASSEKLHTGRVIAPDLDIPAPVVLDATATEDLVYRLFTDRARVVSIPSGSRRYENVTVHVSRGHAVGKTSTVEKAKRRSRAFVEALEAHLGPDRHVLAITHLEAEHALASHATKFAEWSTGHWGALDGRNDWREFDTVALMSLPYRPRHQSATLFGATQGREIPGLDGRGTSWGKYDDVRQAIEDSQITVDVIQAINRVRCRHVIDTSGNCEPVDVFVLVPDNHTGDAIVAGLRRSMPGIKIVGWEFDEARAENMGRPRKHDVALVTYLRNQKPGRYPAAGVWKAVGVPKGGQRVRLTNCARDLNDPLFVTLADHGISLVRIGSDWEFIKSGEAV